MYFVKWLIALVGALWYTDVEMRRRSLLGQSEMEKRIGRRFGVLCGCLIAVLVVIWVWISG